MSNINLYQYFGIPIVASGDDIEAIISAKYNEVRRLVTHHDPTIANQANMDLQIIEQARTTLLIPEKRAAYDSSLGISQATTGGLADPQAILQKFNLGGVMTPPASRPVGLNQPITSPGVGIDVWLCPKCQTQNPPKTRYCKSCGFELGLNCPTCSSTNEYNAVFCPQCGGNIRTMKVEKERKERELQEESERNERERIQRAQKQAEFDRQLEPMRGYANRASIFASGLWFFVFYAMGGLIWIYAFVQAGKALSFPSVPGDEAIREKAFKARKNSRKGVILAVIVYAVILLSLLAQLVRIN